MIQNTSKVFAPVMPKQNLSYIKTKPKEEELKEIIQNPNDPLAKFPVRAFGYSNEVGAALSAMPAWGKIAETALWIPALMYLGADIYDKFRRGKEGDYTEASADAAVKQAVFQALASVILPTAAVKIGQNITGQFAKLDKSNLSATEKEELLEKLHIDFNKGKFVKGDRRTPDGNFKTGKECVWERVYDKNFLNDLDSAKSKVEHRSFGKKILDFFGHPKGFHSVSKANHSDIEKYLQKNAYEIYDKQILVETGSLQDIEATGNKKLIKAYKKAVEKAEKKYQKLIDDRPSFIIEKILSSNEKKYDVLKNIINKDYPDISLKQVLVSGNGTSRTACRDLLQRFIKNNEHKELVHNIAKKAEISNEIINALLQNKKLKLGILKTAGGFISLACLAVPIDNFVHEYIIKKFLEPSLESFQSKLSLK